ncbi:ATP-binding protein [Paeniglutamicibacter cryotolerans]|uniref:Signal transduction histidine kinase/phage shock protein PspC (Stress-responsive transcriptional regulator) n=1 Tax=Paeniglutamicibacter cryotolerans TaxID=670079 RepID=A0A839QCX2_9MICC|nr:ATP-binding protein [Paeniglutamicibacter cryotolerans]MBB2993988.1 signal transduction histidine kinase/phage shock protein PspC (stress-responsive transcriptional regulator) [Paeniglutamicibacter cryotolerans]
MTTAQTRPALVRAEPRILAGVCAGLAAHLGLSPRAVRLLMVAAVFAGGAGIVLYGWLWIFMPTLDDAAREAELRAGPGRTSLAESLNRVVESQRAGSGGANREILAGAGLLLVAGLVAAQLLGLQINWGVIWPVLIIVAGAVITWMQLDSGGREGLIRSAGANRAAGLARLVAGVALVVLGLVLLLSGTVAWSALLSGLLVGAVLLGGVALVLLPWALRFWRGYKVERASRIRADERAEIAAHLHDSVLQTLALIQRRAGDPARVMLLARAQERELRQWLYREAPAAEGDIAEAIRGEAALVEESHGAHIDVVTVGQLSGLAGHDALLQAAREAMVNAAKHAGGSVSVYVEARGDGVEVFVRDHGPGFDVGAVAQDRLGVRESIIGRMDRNGGSASIGSSEDGTEVRLSMKHIQGEEHE